MIFILEDKGIWVGLKKKISLQTNQSFLVVLDIDLFVDTCLVGFVNNQFVGLKKFNRMDSIQSQFNFTNQSYQYIALLFKKTCNKDKFRLRRFEIKLSIPSQSLIHNSNYDLNHFFDQIYFINLPHRTERREHIIHQLKKLNVDFKYVQWIRAVHNPLEPQVGCAMSHMIALQHAYINKFNKILILEDDFEFSIDNDTLMNKLFELEEYFPDWDIIQWSSINQQSRSTGRIGIHKVFKADTTSAYGVTFKNIILLFNIFKTCISPNPLIKGNRFAIDVAWQPLQEKLNWYLFKPYIGVQSSKFESDIEKYRSYSWIK